MNESKPIPSTGRPFIELFYVVFITMAYIFIGGLVSFGIFEALGYERDMVLALATSLTENSPLIDRNHTRLFVLINQLFTFMFPAMAFGMILYRGQSMKFFKLDRFPILKNALYAVAMIVLAMPIIQLVYWLNLQIPLPESIISMENSAEQMVKGLLVMESPLELAMNIGLIAIVPAIGEELLFRGLLQNIGTRLFKNPHTGIWIAAFLFSAIHMQFQGFFPRFFLGALLGYLLYFTNNLWVPILAHFFFNGIQVFASYFWSAEMEALEEPTMSIGAVVAAIIASVAMYFLLKLMYEEFKVKSIEQQKRREEEDAREIDLDSFGV